MGNLKQRRIWLLVPLPFRVSWFLASEMVSIIAPEARLRTLDGFESDFLTLQLTMMPHSVAQEGLRMCSAQVHGHIV